MSKPIPNFFIILFCILSSCPSPAELRVFVFTLVCSSLYRLCRISWKPGKKDGGFQILICPPERRQQQDCSLKRPTLFQTSIVRDFFQPLSSNRCSPPATKLSGLGLRDLCGYHCSYSGVRVEGGHFWTGFHWSDVADFDWLCASAGGSTVSFKSFHPQLPLNSSTVTGRLHTLCQELAWILNVWAHRKHSWARPEWIIFRGVFVLFSMVWRMISVSCCQFLYLFAWHK